VAIVAIIVVGPKDLPKLMRLLGRWMAQARAMVGEFRRSFEEMAQQADVDDLKSELRQLQTINPLADTKREIDETVASLDPSRHEIKRQQDPDFDLGSESDLDTAQASGDQAPRDPGDNPRQSATERDGAAARARSGAPAPMVQPDS